MYREHHRQAAGHRGRLPASGAGLLAGGPAAAGDRDARDGAQERRHAARGPHQARPVPDGGRSGPPGDRSAGRRLPATIPDALIALGNAYVAAGRPGRRDADVHAPAHDRSGQRAWPTRTSASRSSAHGTSARPRRRFGARSALDPILAGAHTALGVVLASTDRRDEAIAAWKRAVELDPQETERAVQPDRRIWRPPAAATRRGLRRAIPRDRAARPRRRSGRRLIGK